MSNFYTVNTAVNVKFKFLCLHFHKNAVLCSEQNSNASDAILASIDQTLDDFSGSHSAWIITGMEEATACRLGHCQVPQSNLQTLLCEFYQIHSRG